jgi:quercetin dioxygenase-like cupin family protein
MKLASGVFALAAALVALAPCAIASAEAPAHVLTLIHPTDATFHTIPNAASCNTMMSLRGDMSKEASTFTSKMTPGCVAPWHWHNSTEEIIIIQGTAKMQMNSSTEKPITLPVGAYSQLPMQHLHRFKCLPGPACIIIVVADRAFDIHWVDKNRKEISFEEALKMEKASAPW